MFGSMTPHGRRHLRAQCSSDLRPGTAGIVDNVLLCLHAVDSAGLFKNGRRTPVVEHAAADPDDRAMILARREGRRQARREVQVMREARLKFVPDAGEQAGVSDLPFILREPGVVVLLEGLSNGLPVVTS